MNFYYINSKGERVNFYEEPYLFQSGDLLDYSWSYDSESGFNSISNVRKEPKERKVSIGIIPDTRLSYEERKAAAKSAADRLLMSWNTMCSTMLTVLCLPIRAFTCPAG